MYPTLLPPMQPAARMGRMRRLRASTIQLPVSARRAPLAVPTTKTPPLPVPTKITAPSVPASSTATATSSVARQLTATSATASGPGGQTGKPIGGVYPTTPSGSQSGYCVFTSSPQTGGVTSVEPCTAGPGGTPISGSIPTGYCVNPGNASQGGNPTISPCTGAAGQVPVGTTPPVAATTTPVGGYVPPNAANEPGYPSNLVGPVNIPAGTMVNGVPYSGVGFQDTNGNIWVYTSNGTWLNLGAGGTSTTAVGAPTQPGALPPTTTTTTTPTTATPTTATPTVASPVPSTQPTNVPYVDSQGNIWTYNATTSQWQITGNVDSALSDSSESAYASEEYAAAAGAPSVPASPAGGGGGSSPYQSIINWLDSDSLISGVQNFWILGGAVVGVYLLKNRGRR
jgi:hypothetical protein